MLLMLTDLFLMRQINNVYMVSIQQIQTQCSQYLSYITDLVHVIQLWRVLGLGGLHMLTIILSLFGVSVV